MKCENCENIAVRVIEMYGTVIFLCYNCWKKMVNKL